MNQYSVKLTISPFQPSIEVAGDLVIKMHVPYSDQMATVQVNPNITDYRAIADAPNLKVRQVTESSSMSDTLTLRFELGRQTLHKITIGGKTYLIELLKIGPAEQHGQKFKSYEFKVCEE